MSRTQRSLAWSMNGAWPLLARAPAGSRRSGAVDDRDRWIAPAAASIDALEVLRLARLAAPS